MATAKAAVEHWAQRYDPNNLAARTAARGQHRKAPPYLLLTAGRMRIEGADRMTAARVQEEIDRARASACLDYL